MCEILLTEANVIDVYRKLVNKEEVPMEEIEHVKQRFRQLADMDL